MNWEIKMGWVHFIGIAGVAMGQIALEYADNGYFVTGSDRDIYEPMKSLLLGSKKIKIVDKYNYNNLILRNYTGKESDDQVIPEIVIAGGGLSRKNKEILFAQKRNIHIYNFAQILENNVIVPESSIVVAGSFGKTTTTAALIRIFQSAGIEISYMVGGLVNDLDRGVNFKTQDTLYSIVEGDEYIAARDDKKSKFFYYHPKYLVLTGYGYDHTDVFETSMSYYDNLKKLVQMVPKDGFIIVNQKYQELVELARFAECSVHFYDLKEQPLSFTPKLLGDFNHENLLAAKSTAMRLGIAEEVIDKALANFSGIKRRLEIIFEGELDGSEVVVIDDFGATAGKAKSALEVVKAKYSDSNIITVFEPNFGSRTSKCLPEFRDVFLNSDHLFFPKFKEIKQSSILSGKEFADYLESTGQEVVVCSDDGSLIDSIRDALAQDQNNVILFLASGEVDKKLDLLLNRKN